MIRYVLVKLFSTKGAFVFCLCTLLGTALSYISPYLNGKFVDFLLSNKNETSVIWFALIVAIIGVGSVALSYCAGTIAVRINSQVSFAILGEMTSNFIRKDYQDLRSTDSAHTTQRFFADANAITSFVLANFLSTPIGFIALPIIFIIIFQISSLFAFAAIALLILYCLVVVGLRKTLYRASFEKKEAESSFYALVASQLGHALNLQLFSRYEQSERSLAAGFGVYFPKIYKYGKLSYSLSSIDGIFSILFQSLILIVSGIRIIQGTMTLGEFLIVNSYFSVMFAILKGFMNLFKSYQDAKASWSRVCEAKKQGHLAKCSGSLRPSSLLKIEALRLGYSIERVCSSKPNSACSVFSDFSYCFEAPKTYCIVGENGCGKSTLLYLLSGIYDSRGCVLYDGLPISSYEVDYVRKELISSCPQDLFRPNTTVRDLLEYLGTPYEASRCINSPETELSVMNAGIICLLDKRCESLSGGEIRRVYLYSALRKKNPILILDEPTTGVDIASKIELLDYIKRNPFNQMIIVTSHDDDLISTVNYIVKM